MVGPSLARTNVRDNRQPQPLDGESDQSNSHGWLSNRPIARHVIFGILPKDQISNPYWQYACSQTDRYDIRQQGVAQSDAVVE